MADLNPKIDSFTEGVNKTIPSVTENLSPKIRKINTESAIGSVKGDICNKIDGAVNLITSIKTGAFSLFDKVTNFDLDSFFEGPLNSLTGKINDITKDFNNALDNFKNQEFNLQSSIDNQIKKINDQLTERFESARIAVAGFDNSLNDIKNFSNKTIRDINVNPLEKENLQSSLCNNAKQDLVNSALTQKSITSLAQQQENLINKSNTLINNDKLNEIKSSFV